MFNVSGSRQFGRYVEVEIRDFKSQTKTTIGNEFEIEFEYFKSLDQVSEDDTGKIRIYGLTPETIKSLQDGGGEVLLHCRYEGAELVTLFHAYIARMYAEVSNNTTMTTIECSANLMNYYQTGSSTSSPSTGSNGTSFSEFFYNLSMDMGAKGMKINEPVEKGLSKEFLRDLEKFVYEAEIKSTFVGSHQELLDGIFTTFGMSHIKTPLKSGGFLMDFYFTDMALERIGREIKNGYRKVAAKPTNTPPTDRENARFAKITDSQTESSDSREVVILDETSGLISLKIEYKIATAYADQELFDHEVETIKSQQDGLNQAARIKKSHEREAEKVRKAAEKGKKYTPKKSKYKTTIKINRRYARVKALLNPNVKPQGLIGVPENVALLKGSNEVVDIFREEEFDPDDLENEAVVMTVLRVRNVTFKGNNKRNDWIMDIFSEDTSENSAISEIGISELQRTNSSESLTFDSDEGEGSDF